MHHLTIEGGKEKEFSIHQTEVMCRQLLAHWVVLAATGKGAELSVTLKLEMNPDGRVHSVRVIETSMPMTNPEMRVLIESAQQAVYKASPFKLSPRAIINGKRLRLSLIQKICCRVSQTTDSLFPCGRRRLKSR